jgi:hypothetical protein
MSELTYEEKIEAAIKKTENEIAELKASIAAGIENNDKELLLIYEKRLSMLHEYLENERHREFLRNNATECKVFK